MHTASTRMKLLLRLSALPVVLQAAAPTRAAASVPPHAERGGGRELHARLHPHPGSRGPVRNPHRMPPSEGRDSLGVASYYAQPQRLASGGWFNPNAMTAAHKTLPFGTRVRVTHLRKRPLGRCAHQRSWTVC